MEKIVHFYAHNERKFCTELNDGPFLFFFLTLTHTHEHEPIRIRSPTICVCVCVSCWETYTFTDFVTVVTGMTLLLWMLHNHIHTVCIGVVVDGASKSFRACAQMLCIRLAIPSTDSIFSFAHLYTFMLQQREQFKTDQEVDKTCSTSIGCWMDNGKKRFALGVLCMFFSFIVRKV